MSKNISRLQLPLILILGFLFWMITYAVLFERSTTHWDLLIGQWFAMQATKPGIQIADFFTSLGSYQVVRILAIPVGLWLLYKRDWKRLVMLGLLIAITMLVTPPLQDMVARTRPPLPLDSLSGYRNSYPSGHTLLGTVFYGMVAYLITINARPAWLRWIGIGASILLIFLIGFSRVYLEMHYFTDVIGGWTAGALLFFFILFLVNLLFRQSQTGIRRKNLNAG